VIFNNDTGKVTVTKYPRSLVIYHYMRDAGYRQAVCFTCGNAARALQQVVPCGYEVLGIGDGQLLVPGKWWLPEQIAKVWPDWFDATSGHLPITLMARIATYLRQSEPKHGGMHLSSYDVPTGSGETVMCLRWAFPKVRFTAVYNNAYPGTRYNREAPLNALVEATGPVVVND